LKRDQDAYGHSLWDYHIGFKHRKSETIERSDYYVDPSDVAPENYFATYEKWPLIERKAIKYAKGRVLDVGCGAGRVSIYLQNKKGLDVVGLDNSPLAIKVSKSRGLRKTILLPFENINFKQNSFDTVIMFGNNFGLFGNIKRAKRLFRRLYRMTSDQAVLICENLNPYETDNPDHLSYQKGNKIKGRMAGQLRIRVRYRNYIGKWFDYLIVSPNEMRFLFKDTGWRVDRFISMKKSPLNIGLIKKVKT
jgi:ubiquinone/menaquinone biosynthesis C-methylase UbiE